MEYLIHHGAAIDEKQEYGFTPFLEGKQNKKSIFLILHRALSTPINYIPK
jgi:hypothetical protein